jgi:hypothetical protein
MKQDDLERLWQFFAGYFNQDWMVDDHDEEAVISRFIAEHNDRHELASLAALVETYAASRSELELESSLFKELDCYFMPSAAGMTTHEWFAHVAKRLRAAATARS